MFPFKHYVLISNITKQKTTFIYDLGEPKSLMDTVRFDCHFWKLFESIIKEPIQNTIGSGIMPADIQMTNRQLNKLIWRIEHKMNDEVMEPEKKGHWNQLQNILKKAQ